MDQKSEDVLRWILKMVLSILNLGNCGTIVYEGHAGFIVSTVGAPEVLFFPFGFGVSLFKLNIRKKGCTCYQGVTGEPGVGSRFDVLVDHATEMTLGKSMHSSFATFIIRRVFVVGSYYNAGAYTGSTHFANSSLKPQQFKTKPHLITRYLISPSIEGE